MNILKRGSKGMQVKIAQALLKMHGYNIGTFGPDKNGIDGSYGGTCVSVVKKVSSRQWPLHSCYCNWHSWSKGMESTWCFNAV